MQEQRPGSPSLQAERIAKVAVLNHASLPLSSALRLLSSAPPLPNPALKARPRPAPAGLRYGRNPHLIALIYAFIFGVTIFGARYTAQTGSRFVPQSAFRLPHFSFGFFLRHSSFPGSPEVIEETETAVP